MNKKVLLLIGLIVVISSLLVFFFINLRKSNKQIIPVSQNNQVSEPTQSESMIASCKELYGVITASYGAPCKSGNYKAVADINQDTYVNGADLTFFREKTSNGTNDSVCKQYLSSKNDVCAKHP